MDQRTPSKQDKSFMKAKTSTPIQPTLKFSAWDLNHMPCMQPFNKNLRGKRGTKA